MIMEFCEKGSLERAVLRGKFIRREDRQPEMVRQGMAWQFAVPVAVNLLAAVQ
jgi:hypothetical protein